MCKAFGDPTKAKAWSKHSQNAGQEKSDTDNKKVPAESQKQCKAGEI